MTQKAVPSVERGAPWIPDDSTFGARLALIRQHMRWTNVAQAARECGVPADSWRNWEEGMEPRRLVTIAMAIATRTGVDLDWLVYGRARERLVNPTNNYGSADPIRPRIIARPWSGRPEDIRHGDGRRDRATCIPRKADRSSTSTRRITSVSKTISV